MIEVTSSDEKTVGVCFLLIASATVQLSQVDCNNNNNGELPWQIVRAGCYYSPLLSVGLFLIHLNDYISSMLAVIAMKI